MRQYEADISIPEFAEFFSKVFPDIVFLPEMFLARITRVAPWGLFSPNPIVYLDVLGTYIAIYYVSQFPRERSTEGAAYAFTERLCILLNLVSQMPIRVLSLVLQFSKPTSFGFKLVL